MLNAIAYTVELQMYYIYVLHRVTQEVGGWKNDERKGKNKENKGVFVFGSSFSGLRCRVLGLRS